MNNSKRHFKPTFETTIAEFNKVSIKSTKTTHLHPQLSLPFRILLPQYFNIPAFKDNPLQFKPTSRYNQPNSAQQRPDFLQLQNQIKVKEDPVFKKRVKDLVILAEGMKRAKNKKEESRYYFTLGVVMHNALQFDRAIKYFEEFMKIVIQLGDEKSVELALNTIGSEYMYLGDYQRSKEYHTKQGQICKRADKFISLLNIGLTYQLDGDYQQAYSYYQKLASLKSQEYNEDQSRKQIVPKLVQRIEQKILKQEVFMTENFAPSSPSKSPVKQRTISPRRQQDPIMQAIEVAESGMTEHLMSASIQLSPQKSNKL